MPHSDYDKTAIDLAGEVAELPAEEREQKLDELCGNDVGLRDRVRTLLNELSLPIDHPEKPTVPQHVTPSWFVETHPRVRINLIGPYRLLRRIGVGGMSEVYEAEQQRPRRRVALKLVHPLCMTPAMLRRFEFEVEILGRLEHPGIARVYDAGTAQTELGPQPYFAMELVRGRRLDHWLDVLKPNLQMRLRMLIEICEAVQYAHQHGVIHRDLKPSNILVTEEDEPKVLDFGVATAVEGSGAAPAGETLHTRSGQIIGTLQYMSPEQAAGDARALDTRSDVYALGVIAYQLLSDRLPYDVSNKLLPEAVRIIREEEPTRLSTINRDLGGDLETIVFKALAKEKDHRYSSSAELAADVKRYLEYEPITARPPSAWYQFSKFARRHKAIVGSAATVFVVLFLGVVVTSIALIDARRARVAAAAREREAETARQTTEEINFFLNDMLESADPSLAQGREVTVRDVLERASLEITGKFEKQPIVEGELRNTIGRTFRALGLYEEAREQLGRAVEVRRAALGEDHPHTLAARNNLALVLDDLGDPVQAETVHRDVFASRLRTLGPNHEDTLTGMNNLACNLDDQARWNEAQELHNEALQRRRLKLGDKHPDTLQSMNNLGASLVMSGRPAQALPLLREVTERRTQLLGTNHPSTLASVSVLGNLLCQHGDAAEAEPLLRDAVNRCHQIFGMDHPNTIRIESIWIQSLVLNQRLAEAEGIVSATLQRLKPKLATDHPILLQLTNQRAVILGEMGQDEEAEKTLRQLLERLERSHGTDSPLSLLVQGNLACVLNKRERFADAEPLFREVLQKLNDRGASPLQCARFNFEYGKCLRQLDRTQDARQPLIDARQHLLQAGLIEHEQMRQILQSLVEVCTSLDLPLEADDWRVQLAAMSQAPATAPAD